MKNVFWKLKHVWENPKRGNGMKRNFPKKLQCRKNRNRGPFDTSRFANKDFRSFPRIEPSAWEAGSATGGVNILWSDEKKLISLEFCRSYIWIMSKEYKSFITFFIKPDNLLFHKTSRHEKMNLSWLLIMDPLDHTPIDA